MASILLFVCEQSALWIEKKQHDEQNVIFSNPDISITLLLTELDYLWEMIISSVPIKGNSGQIFRLISTEIALDILRDNWFYAGNHFGQSLTPFYLSKYD